MTRCNFGPTVQTICAAVPLPSVAKAMQAITELLCRMSIAHGDNMFSTIVNKDTGNPDDLRVTCDQRVTWSDKYKRHKAPTATILPNKKTKSMAFHQSYSCQVAGTTTQYRTFSKFSSHYWCSKYSIFLYHQELYICKANVYQPVFTS